MPVGYGDTYLAEEESVVYMWEKGQEMAKSFSLVSWMKGIVSE